MTDRLDGRSAFQSYFVFEAVARPALAGCTVTKIQQIKFFTAARTASDPVGSPFLRRSIHQGGDQFHIKPDSDDTPWSFPGNGWRPGVERGKVRRSYPASASSAHAWICSSLTRSPSTVRSLMAIVYTKQPPLPHPTVP